MQVALESWLNLCYLSEEIFSLVQLMLKLPILNIKIEHKPYILLIKLISIVVLAILSDHRHIQMINLEMPDDLLDLLLDYIFNLEPVLTLFLINNSGKDPISLFK